MTVKTFYREGNFKLIHDADAQPNPRTFTVFLNGIASVVTATESEDQLTVWLKVLAHLTWRRDTARRDGSKANPGGPATIYAGELTDQSIASVRHHHMKAFVIEGLHAIVGDKRACGTAKIKAMRLLLKLAPVESL